MLTKTLHLAAAVLALSVTASAQEFEKPVRLKAAGEPITTEIGHSAPYLYDFNGDGVRDLLVGQFGSGKLRIYRNKGTDKHPDYDTVSWFEAGGAVATVPAG
jgi:hypothetical protein